MVNKLKLKKVNILKRKVVIATRVSVTNHGNGNGNGNGN